MQQLHSCFEFWLAVLLLTSPAFSFIKSNDLLPVSQLRLFEHPLVCCPFYSWIHRQTGADNFYHIHTKFLAIIYPF